VLTINRDPKLFYLVDEQIFPHLPDKLRTMLDQLERCQKALSDFLEAKRSLMPRFYFIGDDDLLEILGQSKNPVVIQSHLKKLFQGIHKVRFNKDNTKITAMVSSANEVVELESSVPVSEKVEEWLHLLATEMRVTLSTLLARYLKSSSKSSGIDWSYPSQVICLGELIRFTRECEDAITNNDLNSLLKRQTSLLRDVTGVDFSENLLNQTKMKSLVFDVVHNMDVVEQLLRKKTRMLTEWQWKKQLRYYYTSQDKAVVKMYEAQFEYTYEYQGNAPKLVHTPLTDKCYLTLTQGMHMGFGGNPYGPAGTGKTESVKALASCLGRQVLVFNCDEALESSSMVRIFIGIIKCGAWGCFDEFNRLKEDQLSAISQQIQTIQHAIKNRISPIPLLNRSVDVNFNSGIFVTLNPAGKGYGGRSRLPDNLKALFRPVAMGAPDNEIIAEVSLVTEGFRNSKDLASKIVSLFKLSKQLLSPQQHYDWGLRALKAVLNSGGRLIQAYKSQGSVESQLEYEILIKAIRVNTLSKLTYADTMKFLSLINDVFPGIKSDDISGGELEQAIKEVMREKPFCLQEDPAQVKKMIQLKESLDQRMGCVIVGPSGCGKSSLWQVLKQAIIKCGQPVVTYVMNPKAMERVRLLGHMDADTTEWTDGVLTDAARKVVKESSEVRSWIICDGDVDPEWIESLNSVLDDNHLLTMPNGERISFGSNVNFLFETHDLKFASPATVSRMGMIFLSDDDLDVTRIVQRWVSSVSSDLKPQMLIWINELFYKALDFVVKSENVIHTTIVGTVMNGLSQIKQCKTKEEFICGLIRGLGGNLSLQSRQVLAKEVFQLANDRPPDISSPLDCYAEGNVYKSFATNLKAYNKGADSSDDVYALHNIEQMVVPTVSVQRTLAAINSWIVSQEPFILVGPEGCGKAMTIAHAFKQARNVSMATLHCNAQTTANDVVNKIAQSCSLFSAAEGRVYRPRDCERLVLYLKDINLPRPDMYDTCQLIAFLQQLLTFGGFYDENLEFLRIERIQIVASINAATTVGRHLLSTRFTATVRIFVVDYPETNELVTVYDKFLQLVLKSISLSENTWTKPSEREKLAYSIVEIYEKTKEKFTVDERRHYLFTPRDITSLVKNISRYNYPSESILASITHEAHRIFRDRLINADACNKFDQLLNGIMHSNLKYAVPDAAAGSYYTSLSSVTQGAKSEGKDGDDEDVSKQYTIGNKLIRLAEAEFKKIVEQGIMYYEREEKELHMLLISETLERICHIDRILSSNGGHILLAGSTGMGRRNMVSVVAYMLQYQVISPATSRDNPVKQFTIDVKSILYIAGVKGEHVVMLIEDYHIVVESILEIVNSLLSSGEVPGMYTHEELEPLIAPLREKMREDAGGDSGVTYRTPYDFFVARIRRYLHIVLCMDPANPKFVYRCESNPAIYSQCAVIWIGEWRLSSLKAIPLIMSGISSLLDENNDRIEDSKEEGKGESKDEGKSPEDFPRRSAHNAELLNMVIGIHNSCVTKLSSTPREYIAFLNTWYSLYNVKKTELTSELKHLEAGLSKLDSAAEIVNDLRTNAATQQKDLALAQAAADRAMEEISKALGSANERKNEVAEVKRAVAVNEEATKERKAQIESELAEIQPILDSAKQAVGQIKPEHLNEIRSLTAPPEAIADVLAAVLMLLGVQDLSWLSMKKFLTNRGVKEDIMNYDAKRIDATLRSNVAKLIKKKSASFDAANIQRVSIAAAPMAAWVKANIKYSIVIEKIEPLEAELNEEVMKLEQSQRRLQRCEDELKEIDERVANLKTEFGNRTAEADRLTRNLALAGTTLDKAEKLIGQLSGEQQRWKSQVKQLRSDLGKISVKALLAAGFCTYLAKCPEDVRSQMVDGWADITSVRGFSFKRVMSTESQLLQWKQMGLPADDLSHENSLVLYNTSNERVPFIIDPASACTTWLRSILSADRSKVVEVVSHHDPRFVNQVELAVRFGKVLIVLDLDGLEAMLYPLCRKDLMHQGSRWVVNIGEKTIDYNESFRLYLVTRNPEPDLPPDAAALVNQINYTVTRSGLEWQLLGIAIQHEQPELEKAKGEMLKREEDFKVQLGKLEKDLLEALATAEGNLLENTALIESLTRTKEKSAEIEESLLLSADASSKLDREREVYRVFALAGSKLFFLVKGLQAICVMYKFSLASFLSLYKQTLAAEMKAGSTEERLHLLCENLEIKVLHFIGRALFKADRPMFALHLVRGMNESQLQPKEWEIFTGALVSTGSKDTGRYPSWAAPERQAQYQVLSEVLPQLVAALELDNSSKWSKFANAPDAERHIPSLRGVTAFQKVLITQALRPDRLQSVILQFCNDLLHVDSISPPTQYLSLPTLYSESTHTTPILLISSPGADPSKELQEFATKTVGINQYEELAMGGGQQEVAVHMLKSAASNGTWLCLKNLHLVVAWLPTLEKEISSLQNVQPEFRLWLTSESHQLFPTILLQQALKATYESPPGLKQNLQRVMESFDPHVLFSKKEVNEVKSKLLFLLAAFHSVIQERRTYIPQGWTKFYEFSFGDMRAGTFIIDAIADSVTGKPIDYETIYGLMEDAIYGGRIDNAVDMRILRAYLQLFFNDEIILRDNRSNEILKDTGLVMPKEISYESFINVISKLPDSDAPQTFCLPVNIERSLQRTTSANVIKQLRAMSTMDVEINKYDREKWRESLGPTLDMWKKMYDGVGSKGKGGKGSSKNNPIRDFIDMECNLTTELCSTIDAAIASLNKVLFGSGLLTPAIQATAIALLSDRVPGEWLSMWDGGPEKPQKWLREVVRKRNALQKLQSNLGQSDLSVALSRDSCMSLGTDTLTLISFLITYLLTHALRGLISSYYIYQRPPTRNCS
jgi:dynein heavy chain 2